MLPTGTKTLHLRIADFKFTHNFIICDQLPETGFIFGIDMQRKFSLSYTWDKERNCYIQKEGKFLTYMNNCEQKATIGTVKLMLKYHHNTMVSCQLGQADPLLKNRWHTSLQMTTLQKEETQT